VIDKNIDYKDFLETNLLRLTMELVEWMEAEMIELNKTSQYRGSIAEIRLFNALRGEEKSISEVAKIMNISRQAVHQTVHKLVNLGFLELISQDGNKKNKIIKITALGQEIRKQGSEHLMEIERKLSWNLGERNLEFIKTILSSHSKHIKK
jgi:DNA-binding MarR family transcriptional regulator